MRASPTRASGILLRIARDDDTPRRKPGRPRSPVPSMGLSAWVPVAVYDRLARLALRRGESVSELTKAILERATAPRRTEPPR